MRKLPKNNDWFDDALCKGMDANLFFEEDEDGNLIHLEVVQPICKACPVSESCRDYATSNSIEKYGFWGDTTFSDRLRIKRLTRNPYDSFGDVIDSLAVELVSCL